MELIALVRIKGLGKSTHMRRLAKNFKQSMDEDNMYTYIINSAASQKTTCNNKNKDADQPAHAHILISVFAIPSLERVIAKWYTTYNVEADPNFTNQQLID